MSRKISLLVKACVLEGKQSENREEHVEKPHLNSFPAEDGQGEDDGGHAAVGDGDDHDRENLEVVRYVRSLDECVRGNIVVGANCVGRVGEKGFAALSGPEVDMDVPANTLLKISKGNMMAKSLSIWIWRLILKVVEISQIPI